MNGRKMGAMVILAALVGLAGLASMKPVHGRPAGEGRPGDARAVLASSIVLYITCLVRKALRSGCHGNGPRALFPPRAG
jgi:hypothetical protein